MSTKNDRLIKQILFLSDILAIAISGFIAVGIRFFFRWSEFDVKWYFIGLLFFLSITLIVMYFNKLYDLKYKSWFAQVPGIINSYIYSLFAFAMFSFFVREVSYSRLVLIYFSVSAVALLLTGRYAALCAIKKLYQRGIGAKKLLCLGIDERSLDILKYLHEHAEFGFIVTGYLDDENKKIKKAFPYLGRIEDYAKVIDEKGVSVVLISSGSKYKRIDIIEYCEEKYIQVYMIPDILDITSNPVDIGQISTIPLIKFKEGAISPLQAKIKRLFDLICASFALIMLSPLFLLIIILIKVTTRGSVFFIQERYGMNGELIKIIKFRTMVENAEEMLEKLIKENPEAREEYNTFRKLKNDPRITPIGRILRNTSLDELPQLINIIMGDLSIVGPRPMLLDEMERYGKYKRLILKVNPGLTGLWQISGRNELPFSERVKLDIYYINNWSFWLDIMIILKTIPALLHKNGAY
ncbi:MAG: sugar transferase [Tepidanaerobacteraceae bacterium]|jgi:exopolysaccharide biosynthesis polyprenyl glycosylphosphotransferase|nr:sugar transferase [Tepidanaerobacteraceae bacterium]